MNRYATVAPDPTAAMATLLPLLLIYGVLFLCLIANYVISSIGLYRMARTRGIPAPGLAWVPFGRDWLLGGISGNLKLGNYTLKNTKLWLVLVPVISILAIFVMYFVMIFGVLFTSLFSSVGNGGLDAMSEGMVFAVIIPWLLPFMLVAIAVSIVINLVFYMAYYQVFSQYKEPSAAVFYLILSILVPLANAILLFRVSTMPILYPRPPEPQPLPLNNGYGGSGSTQ